MEVRNHRITKRGIIFGSGVIAILAIFILTLVIVGIRDLIDEHNYVSPKYAVISGELWKVSSQISGKVDKVYYKIGDTVKKGDSVISLDKTQIEAQLNEAKIALSTAKAQLKKAAAGAPIDQLDTAKAQLYQAEVIYDGVKVSRESINNAIHSVNKTLSQVEAQMKPYIDPSSGRLDKYFSIRQLKSEYIGTKETEYLIRATTMQQLFSMRTQLEIQLTQLNNQLNNIDASAGVARAELRAARGRLTQIKKGTPAIELALLNNMVKVAKAVYGVNALTLNYVFVKAPNNGVIISSDIKKGEVLSPGETAATMMDLSKLYVTAYVDQADLHRIIPGQIVKIKVHGDKEYSFNGKVSSIGNATMGVYKKLKTDSKNVDKADVSTKVPVRIDMDYKGIKLTPGVELSVKIKTTK